MPMFAAMGSAGATLPLITSAVASFIKLYLLLLFVRVLLTWFPNVDWQGQPWVTLRQVTDPYLNLFRNLIPPLMGQIDFTPSAPPTPPL
jgi:YggT family protein